MPRHGIASRGIAPFLRATREREPARLGTALSTHVFHILLSLVDDDDAADRRPADARRRYYRLTPQICLGDRVAGSLAVPVDGHDVPARAVVEELNAVDTPSERLGVTGRSLRFVRAEDLGDGAEAVDRAADLVLEESILGQRRAGPLRVLVRRQYRGTRRRVRGAARGNESCAWREE